MFRDRAALDGALQAINVSASPIRAAMEAELTNKFGDRAEQAYARSELFEKRSALMAAWATCLEDSCNASNAVGKEYAAPSGSERQ